MFHSEDCKEKKGKNVLILKQNGIHIALQLRSKDFLGKFFKVIIQEWLFLQDVVQDFVILLTGNHRLHQITSSLAKCSKWLTNIVLKVFEILILFHVAL